MTDENRKKTDEPEAEQHGRPNVPRGDSAVDQALIELEEAETGSPSGGRRKWGREGEAGDTLTPNQRAQQQAQESGEDSQDGS
ncbi:hypothetical protein G6045_07055 [Streptomyces sp. YC504]|uniref:Uncharacterized protein n=1 Tax=Streptomyces mesophilus TaxID=1775132 RepID=A0A6G4XCZ8_9ACTN|nr:hypothetical protein [Streptomyces mesophilus]NGO75436.1 hypothetical protein [Streptomyces mesophilus]